MDKINETVKPETQHDRQIARKKKGFYLQKCRSDGFEIIDKSTRESTSGACIFWVNDLRMNDGDGFPTSLDDQAVLITEDVWEEAMRIFRETGDRLTTIGENAITPIERGFRDGDCLYDRGYFYRIRDYRDANTFSGIILYDYYDLSLKQDEYYNIKDFYEEFEDSDDSIDELIENGGFITKEVLLQALSTAKAGINTCKEFLERIYNETTESK